jgi:hypothetical protein
MNGIKDINMGYPQQTFDFDQSQALDLKNITVAVDFLIADNDQVQLDQAINYLSMQPDKLSPTYILELLNNLFQDGKILFVIDGKKILPENVKTRFSERDQSKLQFLQARNIFSVLRTHLSDPAQWKYVEIIKPEKVKESDLLRARHLGEKLFGTVGVASQNSLCRYLRRHLRMWENDLEMFRGVAGKGQYPGANEIRAGLALIGKLLNDHDPYEFIKAFINDEDRLCNAARQFDVLENFYKNQIYIWDVLIKAVEDFKMNRTVLKENPDVKKALETLCSILADPQPYGMIKGIRHLISIVKPANDIIVEKQMASAKALAFEKIGKMIDEIVIILNEKNASSHMRNKALFSLQTIKKKINMASNNQSIDGYLDEAMTVFNDVIDMFD